MQLVDGLAVREMSYIKTETVENLESAEAARSRQGAAGPVAASRWDDERCNFAAREKPKA